jgi:hypothetical protein
MFGESTEEGNPVDRRSQEFHSHINLEDMLKKQISMMDQFRQLMDLTTKRIIETKSALVMMDDEDPAEGENQDSRRPFETGGKASSQ